MRLEIEAGPTWRRFQMPVRNLDFINNGEPLDAFKPKQVDDTIRSVCTCIRVSLCMCLCLISLFPDYKCSCQRTKSRKKETKNREPTRNVALEELIKIIAGEVKKVNTFFFFWEHESVILLLVEDLLFWLMCWFSCLSDNFFTSVSAPWHLV